MKKLILATALLMTLTIPVLSQEKPVESREMLTLRLQLAQERAARIKAQMDLMQAQFPLLQEALELAQDEAKKYKTQIDILEKEERK